MDKIGPFLILGELHSGSRGLQPVFRARGMDGKEVAIKATPVVNLTPEMRERFMREAETCRILDHPNLIRVFEIGEADGMLYQAMELLEGADLGKVMSEGRQFDWEGKLYIMEQVCAGLEHAHDHGLVHRDIKPANLFLQNSGKVKLLDFGMVRLAESELTEVGFALETLNYMSPEQLRGERVTPATDLFSAGIVFYQLAAGRHPFSSRERSLAQVVSAIAFEHPPKLSEVCPDAPEGLEFILGRALEKDPARRLQNAGDLRHVIELCRMTLGMGVPPPPVPATPSEDPGKTRIMKTAVDAPTPKTEEEGKTRVMQRSSATVPSVAPPATNQPPAAPPSASKPLATPAFPSKPGPAPSLPSQHFSYCPACTFANPVGTAVCQRCQNPLAATASGPAPKSSSWPLYVAIGMAVVLAIALIVVLLVK